MPNNSIILKSCTINPETTSEIEICTEQGKAFKPKRMQIHVVGDHDSWVKSFVEICNISVFGNPQLVNFSGERNINERGNSIYFKNPKDVDFSILGSCNGQGLNIIFANPQLIKVRVYVKLEGMVVDNYESIGQ